MRCRGGIRWREVRYMGWDEAGLGEVGTPHTQATPDPAQMILIIRTEPIPPTLNPDPRAQRALNPVPDPKP